MGKKLLCPVPQEIIDNEFIAQGLRDAGLNIVDGSQLTEAERKTFETSSRFNKTRRILNRTLRELYKRVDRLNKR